MRTLDREVKREGEVHLIRPLTWKPGISRAAELYIKAFITEIKGHHGDQEDARSCQKGVGSCRR